MKYLVIFMISLALPSTSCAFQPDYEAIVREYMLFSIERETVGAENQLEFLQTSKPKFDLSLKRDESRPGKEVSWFRSPGDKRHAIDAKKKNIISLKAKRFRKDFYKVPKWHALPDPRPSVFTVQSLSSNDPRAVLQGTQTQKLKLGTDQIGEVVNNVEVPKRSSHFVESPLKVEVIDEWENDRVLLNLNWIEKKHERKEIGIPEDICPSLAILAHAPQEYQLHGLEFDLPLIWVTGTEVYDSATGPKRAVVIELVTKVMLQKLKNALNDLELPEHKIRTWSDANGKFSVEAKLVAFESDQVKLVKQDGTEIKIGIEVLSTADQEFVQGVLGVAAKLPNVTHWRFR